MYTVCVFKIVYLFWGTEVPGVRRKCAARSPEPAPSRKAGRGRSSLQPPGWYRYLSAVLLWSPFDATLMLQLSRLCYTLICEACFRWGGRYNLLGSL